jgi:hypothetical protein
MKDNQIFQDIFNNLSNDKFKPVLSVSGRVTDYRITDLGELMKLNRLAPFYGESKPGVTDPIDIASQRVSRFALFCPMTISATTILNMSTVTPLHNIMLKEELTEENLVINQILKEGFLAGISTY